VTPRTHLVLWWLGVLAFFVVLAVLARWDLIEQNAERCKAWSVEGARCLVR
jgi:hypothetical protein